MANGSIDVVDVRDPEDVCGGARLVTRALQTLVLVTIACGGRTSAMRPPRTESTIVIPQDSPTVGTTWQHTFTYLDDLDISWRHGSEVKHTHKQHRRHEILEERALAVENGHVISSEVRVVEKTVSTKDLLSPADKTETDPTSGHRYRVERHDDQYQITRDGVKVTDPVERRSVIASALDYQTDPVRSLTGRPIAIGDTFHGSDDASDPTRTTVRLLKVVDGVAELALDTTWTADDEVSRDSGTWRVRISDGRTLSLELIGTITYTKPRIVDGAEAMPLPSHTESTTVYSY